MRRRAHIRGLAAAALLTSLMSLMGLTGLTSLGGLVGLAPARASTPPAPVTPEDRAALAAFAVALPSHGVVPAPPPTVDASDGRWRRYARALGASLLPPDASTARRQQLAAALEARPLAAALGGLLPRHRRYEALRARLARLRAAYRDAASHPWRLPRTRYRVAVGVTAPEVATLRDRLLLDGYGASGVTGRRRAYFDGKLKRALWAWQKAHGLPVTTWLDGLTWRRLNAALDPERALPPLLLALERWRGLGLSEDRGRQVLVHLNRYTLVAEEDGEEALRFRVVVGAANAENATPALSARITRVVVNPSWYVPRRIVDDTLRPRLGDDPQAARDEGYVVDVRPDGSWRVRLPPGPDNPLGRLAFRMPGTQGVFLHDTPAKALFRERRRARSHGCVRLRDAPGLARWLLGERGAAWLDEALGKTRTLGQELEPPVPVHLVYQTFGVDEAGHTHTYRDIYKRDEEDLTRARQVAEALLEHPPAPPEPPEPPGEVGEVGEGESGSPGGGGEASDDAGGGESGSPDASGSGSSDASDGESDSSSGPGSVGGPGSGSARRGVGTGTAP